MIAQIEGKVSHLDEKFIVLMTGGVGYKIYILPDTIEKIKGDKSEHVSLFTHLKVKEDALDLYGFIDKKDMGYFEMLISVSGIGPKGAMNILTAAPPDILERAIATEDTSYLTKVSGIGKKNAEKIILELKDKLGTLSKEEGGLQEESEAIDALVALGYSQKEARDSVRKIPDNISDTKEKVRAALRVISKQN